MYQVLDTPSVGVDVNNKLLPLLVESKDGASLAVKFFLNETDKHHSSVHQPVGAERPTARQVRW